MPPPMIRVMRGSETAVAGFRGAAGPAGRAAASCEDAARKMTRTSSSTERPLRAARSRSSALTASSSFRMVRLATRDFTKFAGDDSIEMIALQSELPDRDQDPDEGHGD